MRYNDNSASAITVNTTAPTEEGKRTEYLLNRLSQADSWRLDEKIQNIFNINVDNTPKNFRQLIEAIKKGDYTIDKKFERKMDEVAEENESYKDHNWGALRGIIWGGKQPDRKGYDAAQAEKTKRYTAAKDIIMGGDYDKGLKALHDFENWLPKA